MSEEIDILMLWPTDLFDGNRTTIEKRDRQQMKFALRGYANDQGRLIREAADRVLSRGNLTWSNVATAWADLYSQVMEGRVEMASSGVDSAAGR